MAVDLPGNISVGDYHDYLNRREPYCVSAAKTAHVNELGYAPKNGDPNYLVLERPSHLTLNWVDGPARLYEMGGVDLFRQALDFIERGARRGRVLIHCDQGMSRSPTLALLYLAKRARLIGSSSFAEAERDFLRLYPRYSPGGIADFVDSNWSQIR